MAITDRNLAAGTKLVARYKKQAYVCEVVQTEEGLRYRVDGKDHKSPSAAGSAVMGGAACNGWRFWSLEGEATEPTTQTEQPAEAAKPRVAKVIRKLPNQKGAPEGHERWYCNACADGFLVPTGETPNACPKGHRAKPNGDGEVATTTDGGQLEGEATE
jgi:hypothetical protein